MSDFVLKGLPVLTRRVVEGAPCAFAVLLLASAHKWSLADVWQADVEHEVVSYYGAGHAFWKSVGQVEREEMPVIAGYRLTTNFLKGYFAGKESFARKRAFLEFQLREQGIGEGAVAEEEEGES